MKGRKLPKLLEGELLIMAMFPIPMSPQGNYHYGGIAFRGTTKWRYPRIHAACDLGAPAGTPVFAVEAGIVLDVPKTDFYLGTYTITVKHANFVVRYGELDKHRLVFEGQKVAEGEQIGTVGLNSNGGSMLHFEMYRGDASGFLSQKGNDSNYKYVTPGNFQRRKDLLDPTPYLDSWYLSTNWDNYIWAE